MVVQAVQECHVRLRVPEPHQAAFIDSPAKRKVVRGGRRGGKTTGAAIDAVQDFLAGKRVIYGVPVGTQLNTFWGEVKYSLAEPIAAGHYKCNETEHFIEKPGTENAIIAKTVWNADTLRGTWGDKLILDEYQLMNESVWLDVGAPMMVDRNGAAIFIYTPPSLRSSGISKALDPLHAAKMFKRARGEEQAALQEGRVSRWAAFHFATFANLPNLSQVALSDLTRDMSAESYRREIEAEDDDLNPAQLIYRAFQETSQVVPPFEVPKAWPRYVGHDFGSANPAALFFAHDPATGYFYAYQEYLPGVGRSTYQHVLEFKRLTEGATVLKRVGGSHQEDEIRQGYTAQGWPIQEPKILNVAARIDRVRAVMEKNCFFVFNTLGDLLHELRTYLWETDADGRVTDRIRNKSAYHLCDAMAYLLSDFTPETVRTGGGQARQPRWW